jgi:peroxiredoxin
LIALFVAGGFCFASAAVAQDTGNKPKEAKPGATPAASQPAKPTDKENKGKDDAAHAKKSEGAKIGEKAPDFTLTDTDGKTVKLADFGGKIVVLEWFNPECPVVMDCYKGEVMTKLANQYKSKNVVWLAINSGAQGQQGHGEEKNAKARTEWKMSYPVLLDESGTVGKAYGSKNTPTMYIIAADGTLAYRGAIDNGNSGKRGDINYVQKALDEILAGQTVTTAETKAYGCSVKYGGKN